MDHTTRPNSTVLLVSGLSGAGKSTVLHALEDQGFFCTDNLPLELIDEWAEIMRLRAQPAAVCIDARSARRPEDLQRAYRAMLHADGAWRLLFVEASDTVLKRRFSAVKRRHPFARNLALARAIALEREALAPIREMADLVLDSTNLTPYELAARAEHFWNVRQSSGKGIHVTIMSFSYRHGIPAEADMVIDVRFLPNPHYDPTLAPLTGRDEPVIAFFRQQADMQQAERLLAQWLAFAWPRMEQERKRYFTLAFGCSGGRHRSVYLAERAAEWMRRRGVLPLVLHRELRRTENSA